MKIYGLIGNPLGHSFSKKYFTEKFINENISGCSYVNFELKDLSNEILLLKSDKNLSGLNVTIPFKSSIIPFLDLTSVVCDEIQACNCIKITDGKWAGFNTDVIGFEQSFIPYLRPHNTKALILGMGGSSKAIAYVLKKLGIDFLFISRKKELSANVISYESVTPALLQEYSIIINTTPVGMFPNVNDYPQLPYESVSAAHYFFDLVYNPSRTLFLSKAQSMGAVIKNGEDMLSIQAEESWRIWNDLK